ncbi:MAG TPA: dienelactone hydrolase family protein [Alphaproteobacteria bacterium]|nr:dienelactone hydrolase family protein [Alphaproteobacteria bacterium]
MDQRIIDLYDEYTHKPLQRRVFLERLAGLVGGTAAASALLPLLENQYAQAAIVDPKDARLETQVINYKGATGDVRAYLVKAKEGPARRPGVVTIHENRGLTPYNEDVTRRIALEGFVALGVDLLSPLGGTPENEDQAREMTGKLDRAQTVRNLVAAVGYLKGRPDATGQVGAVGFCWGGEMANLLAIDSPDVAAVVPFYGPIPNAADVPKIKAKLLLHYAGLDQGTNARIPEYEAALKAAGVSYTIHMYDGVQHAFHNDTGAARYNKEAAELAWKRTIDFLKAALAG